MANLPDFTDQNFEAEVTKSSIPVMVDFGATWCGPCRTLAPTVEKLATEYTGRLKVGAVDIDKARAVAMQYQIMQVPTLLFFKGGKVVDKVVGVHKHGDLAKRIDAILKA